MHDCCYDYKYIYFCLFLFRNKVSFKKYSFSFKDEENIHMNIVIKIFTFIWSYLYYMTIGREIKKKLSSSPVFNGICKHEFVLQLCLVTGRSLISHKILCFKLASTHFVSRDLEPVPQLAEH